MTRQHWSLALRLLTERAPDTVRRGLPLGDTQPDNGRATMGRGRWFRVANHSPTNTSQPPSAMRVDSWGRGRARVEIWRHIP